MMENSNDNNILSIEAQPSIAPPFNPLTYLLDEGLKNAVEVAMALDQPLLLTGEPGTGKTKLAFKVAADLATEGKYKFRPKPLIFNTKTSSSARDLFYNYDAVGHFQAANIQRTTGDQSLASLHDFIELNALGEAIARTNMPADLPKNVFKTELTGAPESSVVLIDEIDKAPRDFPNDILFEIENQAFEIKEQKQVITRSQEQRILIIMTSNSEKNLPEAFLRRCVFYHIQFPKGERLRGIVKAQLGAKTQYTDTLLDELLERFDIVREEAVRKRPATAELIAWLRMLELRGIAEKDLSKDRKKALLLENLSILVKTQEDSEAILDLFDTQS